MATFRADESLPAVSHEVDTGNSPTRHLSPNLLANTVHPSVPLSNLAELQGRNVLNPYLCRPRKDRAAPDTSMDTGISHYALVDSMLRYLPTHAV
jgi:hypothetical protein